MKRSLIFIMFVLLAGLMIQIRHSPSIMWCPDIILLVVIFTSISEGFLEGLIVGLLAGILRGFFSAYTLPADIFISVIIVIFASAVARMFYQHTPVMQIFITSFSILFLIVAHSVYLNSISGNDLRVFRIVSDSWRTMITTVIISPFLFALLNKFMENIRKW